MKKKFTLGTGISFIFLGVIFNPYIIAFLFSPDGNFESLSLTLRIMVFDLFLIFFGAFLVKFHQKININIRNVFLTGVGLSFICCGILFHAWVFVRIFSSSVWLEPDNISAKIIIWSVDSLLIGVGSLCLLYRNTLNLSISVLLLFSVLCSLLGSELVLRLMGYEPYRITMGHGMEVTPKGGLFKTHPHLGYTFLPGAFTITLDGEYTFHITNLPNTLRITHPIDTYKNKQVKKEIWIFGCSFTYGWALNDDETFAWLLQEEFPEYEIVNFGVSGYGTLQPFFQFQEALKNNRKPVVAIIAYASFHDERNAFLRGYRKLSNRWSQFGPLLVRPFARLNKQNKLQYCVAKGMGYNSLPLIRYSALFNLLDSAYNTLQDHAYHNTEHDISKAIMVEFFKLAQSHNVQFVVAGIVSDASTLEMLEYCSTEGMMTVNIAVDLSLKGHSNFPYDNHPSALANKQYAQRLSTLLHDIL